MGKNHASPWQDDAARSGDKAEEAEVRTTEPTVIPYRSMSPSEEIWRAPNDAMTAADLPTSYPSSPQAMLIDKGNRWA